MAFPPPRANSLLKPITLSVVFESLLFFVDAVIHTKIKPTGNVHRHILVAIKPFNWTAINTYDSLMVEHLQPVALRIRRGNISHGGTGSNIECSKEKAIGRERQVCQLSLIDGNEYRKCGGCSTDGTHERRKCRWYLNCDDSFGVVGKDSSRSDLIIDLLVRGSLGFLLWANEYENGTQSSFPNVIEHMTDRIGNLAHLCKCITRYWDLNSINSQLSHILKIFGGVEPLHFLHTQFLPTRCPQRWHERSSQRNSLYSLTTGIQTPRSLCTIIHHTVIQLCQSIDIASIRIDTAIAPCTVHGGDVLIDNVDGLSSGNVAGGKCWHKFGRVGDGIGCDAGVGGEGLWE
mmetsp:Transcript_2060/g.4540  ORF Transcript_2060/g.4540 Transcript_2060/m.4540 type:complete len:346 (+) Transcript_2060:639-1676(+)